MKIKISNEIFETLVLYAVFFLPAYLQFGKEIDSGMFESVYYNFLFLITMIPQLLLLIYIISKKHMLHVYGFRQFSINDLGYAVIVFLIIWITISILMLILTYVPLPEFDQILDPEWSISKVSILPLLFIVSMVTGYLEEGFFRCYLYRQARRLGAKYIPAVLGISLLFGTGHLYQGLHGLIMTTAMGIILQLIYTRKYRSIHPIAIGHGLYNFSVFVLAVFFK